ncbi:tetratricopeptide repeat protein [Streptomyces vietnamensis]|uniref:tetratricopeptide repeat protein n=1 Tax=Streptomyces vietnamensis TaxID=362257 RepID=UPI0037917059
MTSRRDPEHVTQRAEASGHARIIQAGGDVHVWESGGAPAPQALEALPPAPELTGRTTQTGELLKALAPGGTGAGVTVVTGLPGVGKTALALHTAHQAVARGRFPGGTLFVHLRGYAPTGAVGPEQALEALLRALGIRADDLPPTVEEQAGLYQSELAHRARDHGPVLILADDASSPAQLLPLIPAHPAHRLLATSRDALTAPDFRPRLVPLDELDTDSAGMLIATALAQVRPEDPRAKAEPEALEQVAGHCGRLPLALTIAAALLTDDPGLRIATLADDLADTRTRLEALRHQDADGRSIAVRAAFDLSHQRLGKQDARLFRLLALNLGPDLSTETATALDGRPARETRGSLAALARACLISEQPTGAGRWRAHDLIRLYAEELPPEQRENEALERLLTYYLVTCDAADDHLRALPGQPVPETFPDRATALTWLDAEHANLIAMIPRAAADHPRAVLRLVECLHVYLAQRRRFHDILAIGEYALSAAYELGDRRGEGIVLNNLGNALSEVRRFDEAITAHTQDLTICRELGDRHGEGTALNNLGISLSEVRRFDEAITAHTQGLTICRELGDRHGEGIALNNLGGALREVRRFDEAVTAHTEAADICRELGDRHGEGQALNNLGNALNEMGRFEEAITAYTQDLTICREFGDRHGEGAALNNLGSALSQVGRFDEAITAHIQDLTICHEFGDRHGEGAALNNLGSALSQVGRFDEAVTAHTQAVGICRELGDTHKEALTQRNLDTTLLRIQRSNEKRGWRRWFRRGRAGGPGA